MFDFGWSEIAIIAVLALIVIGPKDLPKVLRTIGKWVRQIRSVGAEFQRQMDDVMKETGADEIKKEVNKIGRMDLKRTVTDQVDPDGSLKKALDDTAAQAQANLDGTPPISTPIPKAEETSQPQAAPDTTVAPAVTTPAETASPSTKPTGG